MKYKAILLFLVMGSLFMTAGELRADNQLTLADSGKTEYQIVLPDEPTAIQKTAATELQKFFGESTGADLPVVSTSEIPASIVEKGFEGAKLFIIGPGTLSQKALGNVDESSIGYDGIILKNVGDAVVLSGAPKRGPMYAVYEFLEKKLGCRWWTSSESTIPHYDVLKIEPDLDVFYAPKLVSRESYYRDGRNGIFAARSKCNGNGSAIPIEYGGRQAFQYFVHSSFPIIPPQKYFLDHPDWFSEIDGVRKVGYPGWAGASAEYKEFEAKLKPEQIYSGGTQLCFSNDEMIAEMVKNCREALRKNPQASFLSISQNDWRGFCTCEKCKAIDDEDGSHAGSLLRGVNKVAEALEEEFPDLYVETLAYQYTRKPPKVTRPRKNVVIRLCSIECSFATPLFSATNASFRDDLVGWSKIADNLFVWDYATDFAFYLLPFPNYRVIAPNLNFYIDHNVIGFFEQGDYQCETGDFVQMRNWIVSKLLYDPSLDQEKLRDEFVAGYYAPEFVPIYRDYFNTLSDAVEKSGYYLGIYQTRTNGWLDAVSLIKATKLQHQALETAERLEKEQPEKYKGLVAKVRREQIPIDFVWLQEYRTVKLECRLRGIEYVGPQDPGKAARDLVAKLNEFGLTLHREGESRDAFEKFKNDLIASCEDDDLTEAAPPEFCKNLPENTWLVVQDNELNKVRLGELTFSEQDSKASNGRAVMMPGRHYEWATNWHLPTILKLLKPVEPGKEGEEPAYHIWAYLRCNANANDGLAMTAGVYNEAVRKGEFDRRLNVEQLKSDDYVLVDLGTVSGASGQYLWFAPPKRPGEVDSVWIDRVVVVREK